MLIIIHTEQCTQIEHFPQAQVLVDRVTGAGIKNKPDLQGLSHMELS